MVATIKFDSAGLPESPTLVLEKNSGEKIGVLNTAINITFTENLNSYSEISFSIPKRLNGRKCPYWHQIRDFRLIYVPEWKKRFELHVEVNQSTRSIKSITGKSVCECELSNIRLFETEINTESDIARKDYKVTVLYDENDAKASLLHRILADKAQFYKIIHVDKSIQKIQRTFSFDDISIYDAFQEIAEEIHCLFVFGNENDNGEFRTISVYDLDNYCNECGYRGEFTGSCPKCKSNRIDLGYGTDTTIFISTENLADEIVYTTDTDSVKNCFRLEAGDEEMTSAIINSNPSGSQYLWYITDYMKEDMSKPLVDKLNAYDKDYAYYQSDFESELDPILIDRYNTLIAKYQKYDESLESITVPIKGYSSLMKLYYDTVDFGGYLQNSLMPTVKMSETTAEKQAALLTAANLSPVSVENIKYISLATANSAVLNYAKVYIDTARYKIKVKNSSISGTIWTGNFTVTSYSDEEDTSDSKTINVQFNNDYENFLKQKIDKALAKEEDEDLSIVGLFKKSDTDFKAELKKYSLSYLQIFYESCQTCLNILIEQGIADKDKWNSSSKPEGNLYESLYKPYLSKSTFISQEMKLREEEIQIILGKFDSEGNVIVNGLQTVVLEKRNFISERLNFQKYLGNYWFEFCRFRREDSWKNDNYKAEGLSNTEIFKKANEFLEAAKKDLYKSSTLQHSISTTLKNLLVIPAFSPLKKYFSVGNWLRVMIDETVYKLRLISYEINYDDLENISVEFSDIVQQFGALSDIESILKQSQSMSSSYSSVKHQATAGAESNNTLKNWVDKGLDATVTKIINSADNQDIVYDRHGLLFRKKDDISDSYSPIQLKIINSTLAMTTDAWQSCKVGVGQFEYLDPKDKTYKTGYGIIADKIVGNIILSQEVGIYNESGSMTFDTNGLVITNNKNTVKINPNAENLFVISNANKNVLYVDTNGNLNIEGKLTASSGSKIGYWTVTDDAIYNTSGTWGASNGKYFGKNGISVSNTFKVDSSGNITSSGTLSLAGGRLSYSNGVLSVSGKVSASSGSSFGHWTISDSAIYNGNSSFGTKNGKYFGSSGLSISDTFKVDAHGNIVSSGTLSLAGGKLSYSNGTLNVTGKINTTGGTIANWTITENDLYHNNSGKSAGISSNGSSAFWAGSTYANRDSAPFRVGHDGSIYAKSGTFGGSLNAASGSFNGTLTAVSGSFTSLKAGVSEYHPTWITINADGRGVCRIGTPDYKDWVDLTLRPDNDNIGNIGTPDYRWSTCYSVVFGQSSSREIKEDIQIYNIDQAYEELKNMPLYTFIYKGFSPQNRNMSLGTMIDYIPSEVMMTTPNGNDSFNLANLNFWHIATTQVLQKKIEKLEAKILDLESKV